MTAGALLHRCFVGLFSGGARSAEVMVELEEEASRLDEAAFALLTWRPEEEREFDQYVSRSRLTYDLGEVDI